MVYEAGDIRRVVAGKDTVVALVVLLAGWAILPTGYLPGYFATLLPTLLRNVYLPELGYGLAFFAIAFLALYVEAVILTALYYLGRDLYNRA